MPSLVSSCAEKPKARHTPCRRHVVQHHRGRTSRTSRLWCPERGQHECDTQEEGAPAVSSSSFVERDAPVLRPGPVGSSLLAFELHHAVQLLQWQGVWRLNECQLGSRPPDWTPPPISLSLLRSATSVQAKAAEHDIDKLNELMSTTMQAVEEEIAFGNSCSPEVDAEPLMFQLEL
eukprot:CAMPEP_0119360522 /NCGR_PEP_ID=MMETSP1334-20130426/8099_1 /TAXON_ID=127549 /ORGANISM="Calcidiscus leptoporus, Strain RCC1130" /LENGTH=175 /DNA_ID=CAMNT_0007375367 /DNA_START=111 /DNA_END=638 /DNA_ORIENTATION=-